MSLALAGGFFTTEPPGKHRKDYTKKLSEEEEALREQVLEPRNANDSKAPGSRQSR